MFRNRKRVGVRWENLGADTKVDQHAENSAFSNNPMLVLNMFIYTSL